MQPIYQQDILISADLVDRYGILTPSKLLFLLQEAAGIHFSLLSMDYEALAGRGMFWAVTRHKVQITRLPHQGETIRLETWPMPATKVAFPRSVVAYDEKGRELFRSISLWVLMDRHTRSMILPGKSGIVLAGTLRGNELASPLGLPVKVLGSRSQRSVCYTDLDRNGHMNNTRCMDWIADLLPSAFHAGHSLREFTVCYFSESYEGENLDISWGFPEDGCLQADAFRQKEGKQERVFSARLLYL